MLEYNDSHHAASLHALQMASSHQSLPDTGLPIPIWHKDLTQRYNYMSQPWKDLLLQATHACDSPRIASIVRHSLQNHSDAEILPQWLNDQLLYDDFRVIATGQAQQRDIQWPSKTNELTLRIIKQPLYNDEHTLCGLCGYAIDVSREYQLQQQLQQQSQHQANWLHALQNHTLIANMDRQGHFTYISEPLKQLIGHSHNSIIGLAREQSPLRLQGSNISHYLTLAEQGNPVAVECSGLTPSGQRYWLRSLIIALHSPSSLEQSFLEIFTDLTSEKVAAAELESVNNNLLRVHNENTKLISKLEVAAHTDPLTGLANRRALFERAQQEENRAKRQQRDLSVMALDIDHFKRINDHYGHDAGDQVLQSMAAWGKEVLRDIDLFARIGGEEFVVLLPDTGLEQATVATERLRQHIELGSVALDSGQHIRFRASFGVVQLQPDETVEAALIRADKALYQAKACGRNCVRSG